MIGYRDMTFCTNPKCTCPEWRRITDEVLAAAEKWWGGPDFPICVGNVCGERKEASDAE